LAKAILEMSVILNSGRTGGWSCQLGPVAEAMQGLRPAIG
jgi:hypothetical protein